MPCAVVCDEALVGVGDGELLWATTGDILGEAEFDGVELGVADGVGDVRGDGVARGVGVGLADAAARSPEFRFPGRSGEPMRAEFEFELPRLCESAGGGAGPGSLRVMFRAVEFEPSERDPGMVNTTSSLLPRCSTRAVAPG